MPQLDKVTFLSQFFWLAFFFLLFYCIFAAYFLPKMGRIVKFRAKKMSGSEKGANLLASEMVTVQTDFDKIMTTSLDTSQTFLMKNYQTTEGWVGKTGYNVNKTHYGTINTHYLQSVGEGSVIENLPLTQTSFSSSQKLYLQSLFFSSIV
jgi:hypothetical protein